MRVATPVQVDLFFHEGRGPELQAVHWAHQGRVLRAIDYFTPVDVHDPRNLKHVLFDRVQVVMITPEEVVADRHAGDWFTRYRPAALFDLGRTPWLSTFAQRHLANCKHYQLMFYDEVFDVICEGARCVRGGYQPGGAG